MRPVNRDKQCANKEWFNSNQPITWIHIRCCWQSSMQQLSKKTWSLGFLAFSGSTETLDGWGTKRKHFLISYFISNNFVKNHQMIWRPCLAQPIKQPWSGVTKFSTSLDNSLNMFSKLNNHNTLHASTTQNLVNWNLKLQLYVMQVHT